jgi:LAO/AO transport system kinase
VKDFIVYILGCVDGTFYCGHTDDLDARLKLHQEGDSGYTHTPKPVQLLWHGEFETRADALAFELQIKGWSRAKKEALIRGDWERIEHLSRSRSSAVRAGSPRSVGPESSPSVRPESPLSVRPEPVEGPVPPDFVQSLTQAILHADPIQQRRGMAKAITLLESTRPDHQGQADALLTQLLPHCRASFRFGISGVPGVGKSTFIEALGLFLIEQGHRVAVLTIDPSSVVSGGSILGDKTRMEKLSVHPQAYIRPSPSSGTLGGVAEKTREAMLVCEAAGYDIVMVETVGVGQSELSVASMTDMFVLLQLPHAGDDLQAIKKGVMELADLVVINKADIDADAATRAQAHISGALHLLGAHARAGAAHQAPPLWQPQVIQVSALQGQGLDALWAWVMQFRSLHAPTQAHRRQQQAQAWMWERIHHDLKQAFAHHPQVQQWLPSLTAQVTAGALPASTAARQLLEVFRSSFTGWAEPVNAPSITSTRPLTGSGPTTN